MPTTDSFDTLLAQLHAGDDEAAARIFHRFADRLIALAHSQLRQGLQRKVDPEDVLQSVFRSFVRRLRAGQFQLDSWDSLWAVLTVMTLRKCGHLQEYFQAARRDVRREEQGMAEAIQALGAVCARNPTPEEAAVLTDLLESVLRPFDERDRRIVTLHLQGYSQAEICEDVGRAERTVRRTIARVRKRLKHLEEDIAEPN
jgi:RNA polymerase sigma-70 factor (ECF subfamily)